MNVSFVKWKNQNAIACTIGQSTLLTGLSAGPRILSLSYGTGENILFEDYTNFGVGEWLMYGGHRFTTAPENEDSYYPDNEPCEVKLTGSAVCISARQRLNGLQLSLIISRSVQGGFYIDHVLRNNGLLDWQGALWAITCVPRSHVVSGVCETGHINFWPGTDALQWKLSDGKLCVADGDFRGKVGWYSAFPELTAAGRQAQLTIKSPDMSVPELCVDNYSNAEIFVCPYWAELETLSQKVRVAPGASATHRQHWQLSLV